MSSKGTVRTVGGVAVALLLVVGCGGGGPATSGTTTAQTYRAGANLCLSGAAGELGGHMRDGMQLAVDNLNAKSKSVTLAVDFEDSAANPQQGVTVFNDLVQNKKDAVVFTCGTTVIQATLPLAERTKTLMLNTSAGGPDLVGASPWLFNDFVNTRLEAQVMSDYMWKTLNLKSIAVDYRSDAYGSQTFDAFKQYWTKLGGTITVSVSHDLNTPSQQAQVAKITAVTSSTDGLYIMSAGRDAGIFIKEARQAGLKQPIVGLDGVVSQAVISVAGSAAEGVFYTAASYNLQSADAITTEFNKTYATKFGSTAPNTFFMSYYEGVLIWSQLIDYIRSHNLSYTGENLRKALLAQKTFKGLGGAQVSFGSDGSAKVPVEIGKISGGTFVRVQLVS